MWRRSSLALVGILGVTLSGAGLALHISQAYASHGATWYVDNGPTGSDNNTCTSSSKPCLTIQAAMNKANAGDTISIAANTYPGGFTITKNLTLTGGKGGQPTIFGGSPVITVPSGVTAKLGNLTFTGSDTGISNLGTLTLTSSVVHNNSSYGVVNQSGATATLTGVTVSNSGTGISNAGTMSFTGGYVNSNSSGGISNPGALSVTASTVNDNAGNGIANPGTLTVATSAIDANSNSGISNSGGATVTGTSINTNSNGGINNQGTMTVSGSTISGNTAGQGGGVYTSGSMTLANSAVTANTANNGSGGGIFNNTSGLTVVNTTISGNRAENNSGGGIANAGGVSLTNVTISNNSTTGQGGGVYNMGAGYTGLENSAIAGNSSFYGGGDCSGTALSDGNGAHSNNLIGIGDGCGLTNGQNGDQVGSSGSPLNADLNPLAPYGGHIDDAAAGG